MKEILLVKNGEISLKGLNKGRFEDQMIKQIRKKILSLGEVRIRKAQSTVYIEPADLSFDMEEACVRIAKVFGIIGYCRAAAAEKNLEAVCATAALYLKEALVRARTFKVEAKRADKKFSLTSPEICTRTGSFLSEKYPHLRVDVHHPDLTVHVEIREDAAYIHSGVQAGAGGMPYGSAGKGLLLLSGGIDSPVAGWMLAKRGIGLHAVHFSSPPYTSERSLFKVTELIRKMSDWTEKIPLLVVPFTNIQEMLRDTCPEEYLTILMRRCMMKIACRVACRYGCKALITGESVGQVASQTLDALVVTDAAAQIPVFRPLIGMDKIEIIERAHKIGTFETSILPYEDCCTVFTPRHPRTKPRLGTILDIEQKLSLEELLSEAAEGIYMPD